MSPDLNDLLAFARVAECRSFRQAAQELQITASALSHTLTRMEKKLGMRLLQRTTRSVSLTPAGERLLQSLQPALQEIQGALESLNELRDKPVGRLRLNVPRPAAQLTLAPLMAAWRTAYPEVELEVVSSDALIDIVEQGFDAGLRFGESLQQDMVAIPVGPEVRFVVCAAPAYLTEHGIPVTPHDLLQHQCIQFRFPSGQGIAGNSSVGKKKWKSPPPVRWCLMIFMWPPVLPAMLPGYAIPTVAMPMNWCSGGNYSMCWKTGGQRPSVLICIIPAAAINRRLCGLSSIS